MNPVGGPEKIGAGAQPFRFQEFTMMQIGGAFGPLLAVREMAAMRPRDEKTPWHI
jgi:hypothetical protein